MPASTLTPDSGHFEHPSAARYARRGHARVRPYLTQCSPHVWCRGCGTSLGHHSHLLLAQTFFDRKWTKDCVAQYVEAFEKDPSSRGAPRMLPDLVALSQDENRVKDAAAALRTIYGDEALQVLDSRLALERDAGVQELLRATIAHIETGVEIGEDPET